MRPEPFLDALALEVEKRAGEVRRLEVSLAGLHEGFTRSRSSRAPDYLDTDEACRAYLASFMIPNAARALHVLRRTGARLKGGERGIDVGAGTGASALALASISDPDSEILLVDRSERALEVAASLFEALFPAGPRAATRAADVSRKGGLPRGSFGTVIAGHLLNELLPPRGRGLGPALSLARGLASRTAAEGRLVLIEPSQRIPSRALCRIRADLVEGRGLAPVGPCTHAERCPVLAPRARDWCVIDVPFFRPRVVGEVDELLGLDRRRLTVSYLALSRTARPPGGRSHEVMSSPMKAKGGCVTYLCGERGRIALWRRRFPRPAPLRGSIFELPKGARPEGRDRSGAPLVKVKGG